MNKMRNELKKRHERAASDRFIAAYNRRHGTRFAFREQREAPDLVYGTRRGRLLGVEIVTAYYNEQDAKVRWEWARDQQCCGWGGINPDEHLAAFVNRVLADKCAKSYDFSAPCVLAIDARPPLTTERDIRPTVLPAIHMPPVVPYGEVYLGVDLPISLGRPDLREGQYRIWRLYPRRGGGAPVPGSEFPVPRGQA